MDDTLSPETMSPAQRCTAHKSDTGEPCKAFAISGGFVCVYHGGKAPQVREAARRRLAELAPLALEALADLLQGRALDPSVLDAKTGQPVLVLVPPAVRARAAADILSRAGIAAVEELTVTTGPPRPDLDAAIEEALASRGHNLVLGTEGDAQAP